MIRLGIVVQRYGCDIVGGSETLARDVSERLADIGYDVTVYTTTAEDYISWANVFPEGETILKGVKIRRFNVNTERNIASFNKISQDFFAKENSEEQEREWLKLQGPYSESLTDALKKAADNTDLFIFFTYLYHPVVEGLKRIKNKPVILFPTAHDELPVHMSVMKDVFARPDKLMFLTNGEMEFVQKTFNPGSRAVLVRTGLDVKKNVSEKIFKLKYRQICPYIIYAGRIERGKGLERVFEAYNAVREERLVDLVLIGKKLMDIPDIEGLKYMGFVSEEEKLSAFNGAVCSVQPSPYESLSITTLESFSQCTPVISNRECRVLEEHVEISGAGFTYSESDELRRRIIELYDKRALRKEMGVRGYEYLMKYFQWDQVLNLIDREIKELIKR